MLVADVMSVRVDVVDRCHACQKAIVTSMTCVMSVVAMAPVGLFMTWAIWRSCYIRRDDNLENNHESSWQAVGQM